MDDGWREGGCELLLPGCRSARRGCPARHVLEQGLHLPIGWALTTANDHGFSARIRWFTGRQTRPQTRWRCAHPTATSTNSLDGKREPSCASRSVAPLPYKENVPKQVQRVNASQRLRCAWSLWLLMREAWLPKCGCRLNRNRRAVQYRENRGPSACRSAPAMGR